MAIINNLAEMIHEDDPNTNGIYYKLFNLAAGATDTALVAAVTGSKIRILQLAFHANATATEITFNTASTAISPLFDLAINQAVVLPFSPMGWFETVVSEAFTGTTGAGSTTGIMIGYVLVSIN